MPQLDFSVFPSQFFWLVVNFLLMLFIMSKFIIPKTAEMINLRKEKIDGDLEKAAEIKKKVEEMVEKYNEALKNANLKANISLQKTKDELNETIIRRQEDLSAKINAEIEAGEEKIANSKIKALQKIEETSAELAIDVLEKLGFGGIKIKDAKIALMKLKKEQ
jgi:F-type H+-transporting ATPase subunit b